MSRILHLACFWTLAGALPLLDVVSRSPDFLDIFGLGRVEITVLILAICWGPIALSSLVLWAVPVRWRPWLDRCLVAGLGAAAVLPLLNRLWVGSGWGVLLAAVVVGALLAVLLARMRELRRFVETIGGLALAAPVYFLFLTPLSTLVLPPPPPEPATASPGVDASVVVVVLDELPTVSLLDGDFGIDARFYPNFARLAREGTWFRNGTTVASATPVAVAAVVSGRYPALDALAVPSNQTRNLFSLLSASHELNVHESHLRFCHPALCPEEIGASWAVFGTVLSDLGVVWLRILLPEKMQLWLPPVTYQFLLLAPSVVEDLAINPQAFRAARAHWSRRAGGPASDFEGFIESIRATERPGLHYLHVLLPHEPSVHLPDGEICLPSHLHEPLSWGAKHERRKHARLRHLLQLEYVDRLLGRLFARLEEEGLYDSSVIVVTADHGVSHRAGGFRRAFSAASLCDIAAVPILIKPPATAGIGETSDRNVEVSDILPSIADLLELEIPWAVDGRSAFGTQPARSSKTLVGPSWPGMETEFFASGERVEISAELPRSCFGIEEKLEIRENAADRTEPKGGLRPEAIPECAEAYDGRL